jgi:hypothetical protein
MSSHRQAFQHFLVATLVRTTDPNFNPDATKISNQNRWLVVVVLTTGFAILFLLHCGNKKVINYNHIFR